MDALLALFGFGVVALLLGGVPYLLISHRRLKARVARLEEGLAAGRTGAAVTDTVAPEPASDETVAEVQTGPWVRPVPDKEPTTDSTPPRAFVLRADRLAGVLRWLRGNWALAVAGVSLALAGVFMVQYGVEQGLLTPFARIVGALGLGAALVVGGEVIRRRHGDETRAAGVPSVLSGAGIVTLFAAVLAARALYGLIGPGMTLCGLVGVGAGAIVLGWFYGPVLTALGLVGAALAPFLVGGASDAAWLFYYYYAVIAAVGLAVDAQRRWAWISVLALAVAVTGAALLYLGGTGGLHYLGFWALAVLLAVLVPEGRLMPQHAGNSLMRRLVAGGDYPDFPVRLALAMVVLASIATVRVAIWSQDALLVWLALGLLALMLASLVLGTRQAPALEDASLPPALAALALVALEALERGPVWTGFQAAATGLPETPIPLTLTILVAGGVVVSWLFHGRIRGARGGAVPEILWALAAATLGPALVVVLELLWQPGAVMGAYPWALHVMALAGLMVWWAQGARGPEGRLVAALFAGAAIVLITLALFVMLSMAALTLALAMMVLSTAVIDRRFDLPLLGGLAQLGVAVIGYRLVIDPGLGWAVQEASALDVLLAHGGPLLLLGAAWGVMAARAGGATRGVIESACWSIAAIFVSVLLQRWLGKPGAMGHAGLGLMAVVWLATMMAQLYRLHWGGAVLRAMRLTLAVVMGAVALILLVAQAVMTNPLVPVLWRKELVTGPVLLDSLAAAYLPVAAVFAFGAWRLSHLPHLLRGVFATAASGYAAWYLGLEIRRLWQGRDLSVPGVSDGELYSYTLALIAVSVTLLILALIRRSETLRRLAMAGVALTVAKVFVIDMSGLAGLVRVASFLGLGLALAGLAWLNARIAAHMGRS